METWMDMPWWLRMILSITVMAIGAVLLYYSAKGEITWGLRGRNTLVTPGLILLVGLLGFATSFPYDRNKYNF